MVRIEASVEVKRPANAVFPVLSDWTNSVRWISSAQSVVKTSNGSIGAGTTYHGATKLLGRQVEADLRVTEYEKDRRFAFTVTQPFPATIAFSIGSADGRTRVDQTVDAEPAGFFKLAQPLLVTMMKRQIQNDLDTFRDLMDAEAL
jgi:uncharacterized membrane protein